MGRDPPEWLKDGDVVQVFVSMVGSCTNTIRFHHPDPNGTTGDKAVETPKLAKSTEAGVATTTQGESPTS